MNSTKVEASSSRTSIDIDQDGDVSMKSSLIERLDSISALIEKNGKEAEKEDQFAFENYEALKKQRIFSAMVPEEMGGDGASFSEMCEFLTGLAKCHSSTALSCSMHQHIIAANRYNHINGRPGKALLEKVAASELVLVSTGAGDWLASNGEVVKVDHGFEVSGMKHFASGSVAGDLLVTSAPYEDPEEGWQVLHFPVPLRADGVTVLDNWEAMGMRSTGSNSVKMESVFVPEEAIAARRPRGDYHMMWSVILPVALPLIMSVYRGVAQRAAEKAREKCASSTDPVTPYILGEMENALTTADVTVDSMIAIANEYQYEASLETVDEMVKRKTIAANACKVTTAKAVEAAGGPGYLRPSGIENLFRDSLASHFHPLQEKRQLLFSGSIAMGKEPPGQAF